MDKIKEEDAEYLEKVETFSLPILQQLRNRGGGQYANEPDESISERIRALAGMFPAPVRRIASKMADFTVKSAKTIYVFSCNASWIIFTGSIILFAPLVFESIRTINEDKSKTEQTTTLLGTRRTASGPPITLPLIR